MQSSVCLLIKVWSSISLETIKKTIIGEALFETEVVLPHWAAALKGGDLFPQLQSRVDSETSQREYAHMQRLDYETAANGNKIWISTFHLHKELFSTAEFTIDRPFQAWAWIL